MCEVSLEATAALSNVYSYKFQFESHGVCQLKLESVCTSCNFRSQRWKYKTNVRHQGF